MEQLIYETFRFLGRLQIQVGLSFGVRLAEEVLEDILEAPILTDRDDKIH